MRKGKEAVSFQRPRLARKNLKDNSLKKSANKLMHKENMYDSLFLYTINSFLLDYVSIV